MAWSPYEGGVPSGGYSGGKSIPEVVEDSMQVVGETFGVGHASIAESFRAINSGIAIASEALANAMLIFELVYFGYEIALGKHSDFGSLIQRGVQVLFLWAFASQFHNIIPQIVTVAVTTLGGATEIAQGVLGVNAIKLVNLNMLTDPAVMLSDGYARIIEPMFLQIDGIKDGIFGGRNLGLRITGWLAAISLILTIGLLVIQMSIAIFEYQIVFGMAMLTIPFQIFTPMRWLGGKAFSAVIGQMIHMLTIALIASALFFSYMNFFTANAIATILQGERAPGVQAFVAIIVFSALVWFLALSGPAVAKSLLSGMPNLTPAGFARNLGMVSRMATGAAVAAIGGGISGLGGAARAGGLSGAANQMQRFGGALQRAGGGGVGSIAGGAFGLIAGLTAGHAARKGAQGAVKGGDAALRGIGKTADFIAKNSGGKSKPSEGLRVMAQNPSVMRAEERRIPSGKPVSGHNPTDNPKV